MKAVPVLLSILMCSCAAQKPRISTAPSFQGVRHSVNDTGKNIVGVRSHLRKAKTLAEEVDYKLMKAAEFK